MPRRRYVQVNGELIEVPLDYRAEPTNTDRVLWQDRQYQDAGDGRFRSRSSHRQYLRDRGLTTADDFGQEWKQARQARDAFYRSAPDPSRAGEVARSVDAVARGHKPKRVKDLADG